MTCAQQRLQIRNVGGIALVEDEIQTGFRGELGEGVGHFDAEFDADIGRSDASLDLSIFFELDEPVDHRLDRFVRLRKRPERIRPVIGLGVENRIAGGCVDHRIFILVGDGGRGDVPRRAPWRQHHVDFVVENELLGELGRFVDVETAVVINDLDRRSFCCISTASGRRRRSPSSPRGHTGRWSSISSHRRKGRTCRPQFRSGFSSAPRPRHTAFEAGLPRRQRRRFP